MKTKRLSSSSTEIPAARWPNVPLAELEQRDPLPPEINEFGEFRMSVFRSKSWPKGEMEYGRLRPVRLSDEGLGVAILEPKIFHPSFHAFFSCFAKEFFLQNSAVHY